MPAWLDLEQAERPRRRWPMRYRPFGVRAQSRVPPWPDMEPAERVRSGRAVHQGSQQRCSTTALAVRAYPGTTPSSSGVNNDD